MIQNKYLRNLVYSVDNIPINPLVHIFFYITLVFAIGFVLFPVFSGASLTALYSLTSVSIGGWFTNVWGIWGMTVIALNTWDIAERKSRFGRIPAWMGIIMWLYAGAIYIESDLVFHALAAVVPNVLFWWWYKNQVKLFKSVGKDSRKYKDLKESI